MDRSSGHYPTSGLLESRQPAFDYQHINPQFQQQHLLHHQQIQLDHSTQLSSSARPNPALRPAPSGTTLLEARLAAAANLQRQQQQQFQHQPQQPHQLSSLNPPEGTRYGLRSQQKKQPEYPDIKPQQHQMQQPGSSKDMANSGVHDDSMASTSDFVKKLYKMLEDQTFQDVVCWGPQGDCFVVKDMNEFTKSILPRMFKHSNFASFVRQLNKYDFHKVKNTDDNQFGEHSWTFRHPDFHADRRDALENIKRKVPTQRKPTLVSTNSSTPLHPHHSSTSPVPYPGSSYSSSSHQIELLQNQVERLTQQQEEMQAHVRSLERNYQDVLVEMVNFQRNMAQQDGLMQNLIQYFLQVENGKAKARAISSPYSDQTPSAAATLLQMTALSRRPLDLPAPPVSTSSLPPQSSSTTPLLTPTHSSNLNPGPSPLTPLSSASNSGASPPSSRLWQQAAQAGLLNAHELTGTGGIAGPSELEKAMNRQQAMSKIEGLAMQRALSSGNNNTNNSNASGSSSGGNGMFAKREEVDVSGVSVDPARDQNVDMQQLQPQPWDANLSLSMNPNSEMAMQGMEVYTLGQLMPRDTSTDGSGSSDPTWFGGFFGDQNVGPKTPSDDVRPQQQQQQHASSSGSGYSMDPSSSASGSSFSDSSEVVTASALAQRQGPGSNQSPTVRVRRTAIVPAWAMPPRVLLVDDDAVSRKLGSKFLDVFGCKFEVAVDGVSAVQKMNMEKYDLVLMDIVMPKLDGVSATSMIRKFDHMTPIISMTSNSKPNEIMTYFSSGMNDILPKPFTKQGLLDMLEKHLMHMKVIQQMSQVPRSLGVPPLSDSGFEQALQTHAAAISGTNNNNNSDNSNNNNSSGMMPIMSDGSTGFLSVSFEDDGRTNNPLAGMGLTDDMYQAMLQNLISTGQFGGPAGVDDGGYNTGSKRGLDDLSDGRDGKRSRFEVIE